MAGSAAGGGARAALLVALCALGVAAGAAAGLVTRPPRPAPLEAPAPDEPSREERERAAGRATGGPQRFLPVDFGPGGGNPLATLPAEGSCGAATSAEAVTSVATKDAPSAAGGAPATTDATRGAPPPRGAPALAAVLPLLDGPLGVSLAALLVAAAPPAPSSASVTGTISGRVLDKGGGPPPARAFVIARPTDDEDLRSSDDELPFDHDLEAVLAGFPGKGARSEGLRSLGCAVLDLRRARLLWRRVACGVDGAYEVTGLAPGPYDLLAYAPERHAWSAAASVARPGDRVDLPTLEGRAVVIRAVDADGNGVPETSIFQRDGDAWIGAATTDAAGVALLRVVMGETKIVAFDEERDTHEATIVVAPGGPTPVATVRMGEGEARPPSGRCLWGEVTGTIDARIAASVRVFAARIASPADATPAALRQRGADSVSVDRTGGRTYYSFYDLPAGLYAIGACMSGAPDTAADVIRTVEVDGSPRRADVDAPALAGTAPSILRVHVAFAGGAPVTGAQVLVGPRIPDVVHDVTNLANGRTDAGGTVAIALPPLEARPAPREEPSAGGDGRGVSPPLRGSLRVLVRHESFGLYLAPDVVGESGDAFIAVPPPAALLVTVSPEDLAALGGGSSLRLIPRGAPRLTGRASSRYEDKLFEGRDEVGGRVAFGPVPSGAYDLWSLDLAWGNDLPLGSVPVVLLPGVNEITATPAPARSVTLTAPGPGAIWVVARSPATGEICTQRRGEESGRWAVPRLAAWPATALYQPGGGYLFTAAAPLPVGISGDVALTADAARRMSVLVLATGDTDPDAPDPDQDRLREGDMLLTVDGAPVEDALRPLGDRLAPDASEAPIRLGVRRGGRVREIRVAPAKLRRDLSGASLAPWAGGE